MATSSSPYNFGSLEFEISASLRRGDALELAGQIGYELEGRASREMRLEPC